MPLCSSSPFSSLARSRIPTLARSFALHRHTTNSAVRAVHVSGAAFDRHRYRGIVRGRGDRTNDDDVRRHDAAGTRRASTHPQRQLDCALIVSWTTCSMRVLHRCRLQFVARFLFSIHAFPPSCSLPRPAHRTDAVRHEHAAHIATPLHDHKATTTSHIAIPIRTHAHRRFLHIRRRITRVVLRCRPIIRAHSTIHGSCRHRPSRSRYI
jgi:hypothetical protein